MIRNVLLAAFVLVLMAGCQDRLSMNQEELSNSLNLPTGAYDIVVDPQNQSWHKFSLKIDGVPHRYLRNRIFGETAVDTMVEIPLR